MTGYIERETTLEAVNEITRDPTCPIHIAASIEQVLSEAPDAPVREDIHANWVRLNSTQEHYCDNCGASFDLYAYNRDSYRFCPYCGACMDGGRQ